MKQFFASLTLLLMVSGTTGSNNCITCLYEDQTPAKDTAQYSRIYKELATPLLDSILDSTRQEVREAKATQDSLYSIVDSIYQVTHKRIVVGRTDSWVSVDGMQHTWTWLFYVFPNGDTLYYKTIKK